MGMTYLSIIIPTYKRKYRLEKTLPLFLSNKTEKIEFIVVDNNSGDGTEDLIKKYSAKDKRLSYFKNHSNIGPNRNIFRGYLESRGDWFMIMPDDDFINENFLNEVLDLIDKNKDCGLIIPAKKDEKLKFNRTTKITKGEEASRVAFQHSGVITCLIFNKKLISKVDWKLDNSIYPQVRLASEISLISDIIYMVPENKPIIGEWNENAITISSSRPKDYGVFERLDILIDTSHKVDKTISSRLLNECSATLFSWAINVGVQMYTFDSSIGIGFIKHLLRHRYIKSSAIFYTLLFRNIISKNKFKLSHRIYILFLVLKNFIKSLTKSNLYKSLYYGIRNYS